MRAIVLAAGRAQRLRPLTDELPKCLLEVGGRTIISRMVASFFACGVDRVTVVDGFEGAKLRAALTGEFPGEVLSFVHNPVWETTNNAYSLWLALREDPAPMMLLDSDLVFDIAVLERILADGPPNRLALRTHGDVGEEEMKVTLGATGLVSDISKTTRPVDAVGESVGIEVFSGPFVARLAEVLRRRLVDEGLVNEWYESSFVELARAGEAIHPVDLGDLRCMEIDTVADLERARELFA